MSWNWLGELVVVVNCSFGSLEDALRDELGFTNWRRWDYAA